MRPGSPNSSISAEERHNTQQTICLAKALVDCLPNPYDKEALRFKVRVFSFKQNLHGNLHNMNGALRGNPAPVSYQKS